MSESVIWLDYQQQFVSYNTYLRTIYVQITHYKAADDGVINVLATLSSCKR